MTFCGDHCLWCITSSCSRSDGYCAVVDCPNFCGMRMHLCKAQEHTEHICANTVVACPNREIGCTVTVLRRKVAAHLSACQASVVSCFVPGNVPVRTMKQKLAKHMAPSLRQLRFVYWNRLCHKYGNNNVLDRISIDSPHSALVQATGLNAWPSSLHLQLVGEQGILVAGTTLQIEFLAVFCNSERFTFQHFCQKIVSRSNFNNHWRLHADVLRQLDGFIELRCPLHWRGCRFVAVLLRPTSPNGRLLYNPAMGLFAIDVGETNVLADKSSACMSGDVPVSRSTLRLDELPGDVLIRLTQTLDNTSLLCLCEAAQNNSRLRALAESAIRGRLIVLPNWVRFSYPPDSGNSGWKITEFVYCLPEQSANVSKWAFNLGRSDLTRHLRTCPFNERRVNEKPFALIRGGLTENDMVPLRPL
ncbi:F-box protein 30 [Clonorchis sinensis]|uniref:F-box protein 30 n=1 Tax=Clonorchis sinensis TaxID=79923 RepID=G7YST2_CLOSI|nr:F-box protein 30 [Clonorchis sinensis]